MLLIVVTSFFIACRKLKNEPILFIFISRSNLLPPESSKNAVRNSSELGNCSYPPIQNLKTSDLIDFGPKYEAVFGSKYIEIRGFQILNWRVRAVSGLGWIYNRVFRALRGQEIRSRKKIKWIGSIFNLLHAMKKNVTSSYSISLILLRIKANALLNRFVVVRSLEATCNKVPTCGLT